MLVTRNQIRRYLKRILKESGGLSIKYDGPDLTKILQLNSISSGTHNEYAYIPFSPNSAKFLSLMEKRNGTEFGNVLEPIIAEIMVQDGYPGTKDLNISAGGGETVLADIQTPAAANNVQKTDLETVEINDVFISAKASKDFFDLTGANTLGKLPKLIDQSYTDADKNTINQDGIKIIKCKLGAAFAGAYYQDSMAGGVGLSDQLEMNTIVPIAVKLFFPIDHNLAICKGFTTKIQNTDTNRQVAKDTIEKYILLRSSDNPTKLSPKSDTAVQLLQMVVGRCNLTKLNSLSRLFPKFKNMRTATVRGNAHKRFEHEPPVGDTSQWNPRNISKSSNPLSSLYNPTTFSSNTFPTVVGDLSTNAGSESILQPGGNFVDILNDAKRQANASEVNTDDYTGDSIMEETLKQLIAAAKTKTSQVINNYFISEASFITSIGTQANNTRAGGTQYLDLNLQYYNALRTKLSHLGYSVGNELVASVNQNGIQTGIAGWQQFVTNIKDKLIEMSNAFYDNIDVNQLKSALTNAMKEYNKTYVIGTPPGQTKQRHQGYEGAGPSPAKLEVQPVGTRAAFNLKDSNPGVYHLTQKQKDDGEVESDLKVWTISNTGFIDDVTGANPANASAFAEKIFASNAVYTTKNYLLLFQAGTGAGGGSGQGAEAYATKILNNLASGAMTKNPRPQGNVLVPTPDPVSQATTSQVQALKNASEALVTATQDAVKNTPLGAVIAVGQYKGIYKTKAEIKMRYQQIIAQLAQLASDDLHSKELLDELTHYRTLDLLESSVKMSIKSIKKLIESELLMSQIMSKESVIFATNYYNELANLINLSIEDPSDINYNNVIEKSELLINAAAKLKMINTDVETGSEEVINVDFRQPGLVGSEDQLVGESKVYQKILFELLKYSK